MNVKEKRKPLNEQSCVSNRMGRRRRKGKEEEKESSSDSLTGHNFDYQSIGIARSDKHHSFRLFPLPRFEEYTPRVRDPPSVADLRVRSRLDWIESGARLRF